MKLKYELKRLPDVDGQINWKLSRITKDGPLKLISWDWEEIRQDASQLKVGETKIIEINA